MDEKEKAKLYIGHTFEVGGKVLTIGAIEKSIWKELKNFKGKKVLLTVSKKIKDLCDINIDYNAKGFGVEKMQEEPTLKENQFEIVELNNEVSGNSSHK